MAKVLEPPKIKPITCGVCGCKYEFEKGDKITAILGFEERDTKGNLNRQVLFLNLPCPVCGENNNIVFAEKDENIVDDKETPQKVKHEATKLDDCTCPRCGNVVSTVEEWGNSKIRVISEYCPFCGQHLKGENE